MLSSWHLSHFFFSHRKNKAGWHESHTYLLLRFINSVNDRSDAETQVKRGVIWGIICGSQSFLSGIGRVSFTRVIDEPSKWRSQVASQSEKCRQTSVLCVQIIRGLCDQGPTLCKSIDSKRVHQKWSYTLSAKNYFINKEFPFSKYFLLSWGHTSFFPWGRHRR